MSNMILWMDATKIDVKGFNILQKKITTYPVTFYIHFSFFFSFFKFALWVSNLEALWRDEQFTDCVTWLQRRHSRLQIWTFLPQDPSLYSPQFMINELLISSSLPSAAPPLSDHRSASPKEQVHGMWCTTELEKCEHNVSISNIRQHLWSSAHPKLNN